MEQGYRDWIGERRLHILGRMERAAAVSGRTLEDVSLLAVSKTVGIGEVLAAIDAGYRGFAENRPQELNRKLEALSLVSGLPSVRFDMIGNLQTNKINAVLGRVERIHSIESLHLARAVSSRAERKMDAGELPAPQPVLIEVNVSGEATKSGFAPDELRACFDELRGLCGIMPCGLMTMAPRGDKTITRACFAGLRELRDELESSFDVELPELSCGMSEDFEQAIEEGSTIVRLGRVVFDPTFEVK